MDILDFTRNDLGRIRPLQPEGWNDIVPEFEYYLRKSFCFPVKVIIGDQIAGIGVAINLGTTGWLAHIIVDPRERKKGIGTLIVNELLRILSAQGVRTFLLIATEAGKSLYLRAGFRVVTEYIFHKREIPCSEYAHTGNIVPFSENFRRELMTIDRRVTGENREELLGNSLKNASLFISDSALLGYYIPGVGEGPVIALT
ncbi:MAG: N-acetyltransferase, partial [Bacteroidetes bacterium]